MSLLPLSSPPERLCILRLSAIGDVSHTLPTVRTLQAHWPTTRISWIIGKTEHALVSDVPDIDFIIFDKRAGARAWRDLRKQLRGRRFDVLLHMQTALRASLVSLLVDAPIKLGFDRARARDGQWLFCNAQIAARTREHVLDSFYGFSDALGAAGRILRWDIPIPEVARSYASDQLPGTQPTLLISPCASVAARNWAAAGYAAVADYAVDELGLRVLLCGGGSALERDYGERIAGLMRAPCQNLIGQTNLKHLLALIERSRVLLAPDSGPAHLAGAVGTPVIGLYACTNPERAGPYLSREWTVSRYAEAMAAQHGKLPAQLPWGARLHDQAAMLRISPAEVKETLRRLMEQPKPVRPYKAEA